MDVLVTGGHGFVGSHLCERLVRDGHRVRLLARQGADLERIAGLPVQVVAGDLCDAASLAPAVAGVDAILHLAAALKGFAEADLKRVNEDGTRNLAEAALRHAGGLRRFVLVSSLAAAGPSPGGPAPRTEDMPDAPLTWYGATKLAGERALVATALPSVILRPAVVFGPRERDLYGYFRIVKRGLLPYVGGVERWYSLVYVKDLVEAIVRAAGAPLERVPSGARFFVADPLPVTWPDLGRRIARVLGVRARPLPLPAGIARLAGRCADGAARLRRRPEIFSSQKVIEMCAPAWVCSPERAKDALGWQSAVPLDDALAETAAWYRDHGWL